MCTASPEKYRTTETRCLHFLSHTSYMYFQVFREDYGSATCNMHTLLLAHPHSRPFALVAVSLNFTARAVATFHLEAINCVFAWLQRISPLSVVRCPLWSSLSAFSTRDSQSEKLLARLEAPTLRHCCPPSVNPHKQKTRSIDSVNCYHNLALTKAPTPTQTHRHRHRHSDCDA